MFYVWLSVAYFGLKRVILFKVQLCTDAFLRRKAEDVWLWQNGIWFWLKMIIHFHLQVYSPTFRRRKDCTLKSVNKSRSRLRRRRESVATWRILPWTWISTPQTLFLKWPLVTTVRPRNLRQNRRATGARIWGSVRGSGFFDASVIFLYSHAVNRTNFSARLAYGKMTFANVSFVFRRCVNISLFKTTIRTEFP